MKRSEALLAAFERRGFRVIRCWNHEVLLEIDVVLNRILEVIEELSQPPSP